MKIRSALNPRSTASGLDARLLKLAGLDANGQNVRMADDASMEDAETVKPPEPPKQTNFNPPEDVMRRNGVTWGPDGLPKYPAGKTPPAMQPYNRWEIGSGPNQPMSVVKGKGPHVGMAGSGGQGDHGHPAPDARGWYERASSMVRNVFS